MRYKFKYKKLAVLTIFLLIVLFLNVKEVKASEPVPTVSYKTHVQNIGWQKYVKNGEIAGTSGKSLRLEGINIKIEKSGISGDIEYRTHIQNIGWQKYVKNNEMSGTSGKSLRLEAISIRLTGELEKKYDIYYRVHCQNIGWMGWAKNGENAGSSGFSYRLEAIQIKLVNKGSVAPGSTSNHFKQNITYQTHVQDIGWQGNVNSGETAGTSGKALRLEAIKINKPSDISGDVEYRTHVQNIGWQKYVKNNEMSGTSGKSLRLEAISIRLTGELEKKYDIYYRVHCQNIGWMGWAKNGENAGSTGYSYRLEAVQILLTDKGDRAPGNVANHFNKKNIGYYSIDDKLKDNCLNMYKDAHECQVGHVYDSGVHEIYSYDDNYETVYESKRPEIANIDSNGKIHANRIGNTTVYYKLCEKETKEVIDYIEIKIIVVESTENLIKKERDLINKLNGYYWYLDGHEYAYVLFSEVEWYDHHVLNADTSHMEYYDGEIVAYDDEKYIEFYKNNYSENIGNLNRMLNENPSETGTRLVEEYKMYVSGNKLYMTIDGINYSFTRYSSKKREVSNIKLLSEKTINMTMDDEEEIIYESSPNFGEVNIKYIMDNVKIIGTNNYPEGKTGLLIKPLQVGVASIKIENQINGSYAEVKFNINEGKPKPVTEIKLDKNEISIKRGETAQLIATIIPDNATNKNIIWTSSNNAVATVDQQGNIRAISKGTATVCILSEDGNHIDECIINVVNPEFELDCRIANTTKITVIENNNILEKGVTVEAIPNGGSGVYSEYSIKLYYEGTLIGEGNEESLFISTTNKGEYSTIVKVSDSEGNTKTITKSIIIK